MEKSLAVWTASKIIALSLRYYDGRDRAADVVCFMLIDRENLRHMARFLQSQIILALKSEDMEWK